MKFITQFLLGFCLFFLFSSCEKTKKDINEATEFDINYTASLSIPSTSISTTAPADFTTPDINTQSASKFALEKTTQELIDEIKLTKFHISNPGGNLDYLKSLAIYIKTSGLSDVLVAEKTNVPSGISSTDVDLKDVNIKNYLFKEKIQYRVTVTIQTGLTDNQQLKLEQTVHVKGKKIS